MPARKYRNVLDHFVQVSGPLTLTCEELLEFWSYDCPQRSSPCLKKLHDVCVVGRGPLFNATVDDLGMELTPNITIGGESYNVFMNLREGGSAAVPSTDVEELKRVLQDTLEDDLDYNVVDDPILDTLDTPISGFRSYRNGVPVATLLSELASALTVKQVFDFYVDAETGLLDFGGLGLVEDIANNCAEKLAASASSASSQAMAAADAGGDEADLCET